MNKRIISLFLVLALALGVAPAALAASDIRNFKKSVTYVPFADVPSGEWYSSSVRGAVEYGLLNGKSPAVFDPNGKMTVAESITLACRIHSIYSTGSVPALSGGEPWYQPYVAYAEKNGIIARGTYSDFEAAATRADFVLILAGSLTDKALPALNDVPDGRIPDVSPYGEQGEAVYKMYRAGILMGNDDYGTFEPYAGITRAEVSAIANRIADPDSRVKKTLKIGVSSVSVSPSGVLLEPGQTAKLTAAVAPNNADNKSVTWTSSNPAIAAVSADGTVTAVSGGSATVTASSVNGVKSTCAVNVVVRTVLFAPDGRVIRINASQTAAYTALGWFTEAQTLKITDSGSENGCDWEYGDNILTCSALPLSSSGRGWSTDVRMETTGLYIKRGVTSVPGFMFDEHKRLTHAEISDTVTALNRCCFGGCVLTRIGIPASVTSIDGNAFNAYAGSQSQSSNANMVIYCEAGSAAEAFAKNNGIRFVNASAVYKPDGRTMMVSEQERPVYLANGWYSAPVRTMYAADGRTLVVYETEAAAYEAVGWHSNKYDVYSKMYAIDGRSKDVLNKNVAANQAVGWHLRDDYVCALTDKYAYYDGYNPAYEFIEYMLTSVDWSQSEKTKLANKKASLLSNWAKSCGAPMAMVEYDISCDSAGIPEANITFRNLSGKTVTAFELNFTCLDAYGNAVADSALYNGRFSGRVDSTSMGSGEAYIFTWPLYSNKSTRSLSDMYVTRIVYSDGSVWTR